jgi:predicted alpha/beta superfamily hydrolase
MRSLTALVLLSVMAGPASAQSRFQGATHIGQVDSVWSTTLDENRPYLVYTPPSYGDTTVAPQRYPVLYLLDGDAHFHSVSGLIQILGTGVNGTFVVPEMIVVAIPNTDRMRDLTPTHTEAGFDGIPAPALASTGGMPDFLAFMTTELVPRVDSLYRTLPYRVFVGHSLGGITTLNALYTTSESFNAYVAIDPSLWWDDRVLLKKARDFFSTARLEGKALYVAQANTINAADTARNLHFESITHFDAVMRSYDRSGLRYGFRYYDQDSHGSVPLIAEYDALRFIFEGYSLPLIRIMDEPSHVTSHFREVSARLGVELRPSEAMLRDLGFFLMGQDPHKAVEMGEIRTALYPDGYRGWEFLGDAWAAAGDAAKARGFYEQALERGADREAVTEKMGRLSG